MADLTHQFSSSQDDGADDTVIQPTDWNDTHQVAAVSTDEYKALQVDTSEDSNLGLSPKCGLSPEGGFMIQLTNKTGAASVKGSLVAASTTTDNAFELQSSEYDTLGVVYENGVADGSECWVVFSGRAQVLLKDTVTVVRGDLMIAADTDGRADAAATIPPATDAIHFKEIGHCIEAQTGGTDVLAYCVLHFN